MSSVGNSSVTVNPMPIDISRIQRDVAFHRCAQVLADASLVRDGERPRGLSSMSPIEREWFKQTSRQLIELFEEMTTGKKSDADLRDAEQRQQFEADRQRNAYEHRIAIERSRAAVQAQERGHELGPWHATSDDDVLGAERAVCTACGREVRIDTKAEPALTGAALTTGCLTAAETETR